MTLYVIGFILIFLLVLGSGLPVGFGMGFMALGLLTLFSDFELALSMGIEKAYTALDSNILVAVALFVFAAQLIADSGMGKRLFDAARVFFGSVKSGLGIATIASSGVFSAMTGSSFVAASTMGLIAIPELRRAKYSDTLIAAAISAGGSLGAVIPPSIVMIVYGFLTDESIGKLFMAGMIPGLMLVVMYSITLAIIINRQQASGKISFNSQLVEGDAANDSSLDLTLLQATKEAFWGLMAPVIILGGIYFGIFTAPEAAAVAVVYCIIIGFFVYRTMTLRKLFDSMIAATNVTAMIAVIVIGGAMIGYAVVSGRVPQQIIELIISMDLSPYFLLFIINVILFVMGMFLDTLALMYLAIPLVYPVVVHMGWDNVWFAVIMLINVNLGLITPPMGGVLYVVTQIGNISFTTVCKGALMPICVLILVLILVIVFPPLATWIPSMM